MNEAQKRVPIIAVFGSNDLTDLAHAIGREISQNESILLTGGTGKGSAVKDRAIQGLKEVGGTWIGVVRQGSRDTLLEPKHDRVDSGLVLIPALGHSRNYLEACLCDAAIATRGGDGTTSEVVSCLSLERPVVLVGDWGRWTPNKDAIEKSISRMKKDRHTPAIPELDLAIERIGDTLSAFSEEPNSIAKNVLVRMQKDDDPADIVLQALDLLGTQRPGRFPSFLGSRYSALRSAYEELTTSTGQGAQIRR